MGNTLTRSSGEEADLPPPPTRKHSTRSRRSSQFAEWAKFDEHPPRSTLRALSDIDENRPRRRRRRTNPLQETDGNARQAASTAWTTDEIRRNQVSQPSRYRHRRSQAEGSVHRNHKAESHPLALRARLSAEGKTLTRAPYRSNSPRRSQSSRKSKGDLKKNAIHIEVSEVREKPAKRECVICTETRPLYRFPKRSPTTACTHEISTCRHCLRKWIQSSFKTKLWDQINCPECNARLQYDDVQAFAPAAIFKRYDELATRAALEAIPGFRWCIARGCKSGQVHEQGDAMPRFKCSSCKASHCVVHGVLWHKGETCAEYDYRTDGKQKKAEEAASKKWIKQTAKRCPTCNSNIEKVSGCDHMKCLKCRHEFCWACMADFEPIRKQGNEMHRPGCEHYDDGTRVWV